MTGPWRILRQGRSSGASLAYAFFSVSIVSWRDGQPGGRPVLSVFPWSGV